MLTFSLSVSATHSGYVAWVTAAYGPFWGFHEGVWSWLSGMVDNSLYPAMLAANLQIIVPVLGEEGWQRRWVFCVSLFSMLVCKCVCFDVMSVNVSLPHP